MKNSLYLRTFIVSSRGVNLTPSLVTSSELGRWIKEIFTPEVYYDLLYHNDIKGKGYHPGSKIGNFFSKNNFSSSNLHSVYFPADTECVAKLLNLPIVSKKDFSSVAKISAKRVIRCFTLEQVQLFLDTFVYEGKDLKNRIEVTNHLGKQYKICVRSVDADNYIQDIPNYKFSVLSKPIKKETKEMTLSQVEKELGYNIKLVSKKED